MKFVKSDLAKKLIITLVVLLLFNVMYPSMIYALDFGGILLQPLAYLIMIIAVPIDIVISQFIQIKPGGVETTDVGTKTEEVLNKSGQANNGVDSWTLFVDPDDIFSGKYSALNANIFKTNAQDGLILDKVKDVVAKFYTILRNICAVVMLAGLIFTGIRILLSANIPTKKTQYLMLLQDWIIGLALLIFSHIIMILIFELSDAIVNALSAGALSENLKATLLSKLLWNWNGAEIMVYMCMYLYSISMVASFGVAYFKRFFWTCVLVIFAPVMAVMYAFGQQTKQIYSNWLKEFTLNAFVQPFHMIVYTVLISIPLQLLTIKSTKDISTMIYCLIAMSMIRPAEKYMRRLFGMDKGIANMASYESGKQDITNAVKGAVQVAKTAVAIGATVATAGAAAGAIGAAGAGASAGASAGAAAEAGAAVEAGGAAEGIAGVDGIAGADGAMEALPETGDQLGGLDATWENEDVGQWGNGDTWDNARDYLKFQANNNGYDSVADMREAYGDDEINDMLGMAGYSKEDLDDVSEEDILALKNGNAKEDNEDNETGDMADALMEASGRERTRSNAKCS